MTIFTSHHKVITSSRSLQTRLLHQGVSRLLSHDDVDQSQTVSKSADFRCEKMHFCSSESRESRIFGISALKTIVLRNKTKLFSTCNWSILNYWARNPMNHDSTMQLQPRAAAQWTAISHSRLCQYAVVVAIAGWRIPMCLGPTWTRSGPDRVGWLLLPKHADPSLQLRLINDFLRPVSREPVPLMASATFRIVLSIVIKRDCKRVNTGSRPTATF